MDSIQNTIPCLTVKTFHNGKDKTFELKGQKARMLQALIKAGSIGVTALELSNTWAFRTSAYVHDLRNPPYNLDIQMIKEPHDGGWHGRYILHSYAEIVQAE